ncbi:MAG: insulinase family protein [Treponema sp.]|nr:insulinase family protein [Treponema sp.]
MKNKIFHITRIVFFLALLVILSAVSYADDYAGLGKETDKVPLTGKALTGTLPNGLRYYILENSRPENRAILALAVNAGSVLEEEDERGLAHFVEHLAFNDTERFPKLELIEYLRSLGMRFGADANAYTSYDETVYHFDVPVEISDGIKRIPERAFAILDDWTHAVSFLQEDVESESRVILEEMRTRLGAMDRARKIMLPVLFTGSAYANRETIGLQSVIENATSQQLKNFYDRWYTSDNMALVFIGDFDGKTLENELAKHFNMKAPLEPVNRPRYELPPPVDGNFHIEIFTDTELTSTTFMIYYKMNAGAQKGTLAYYRESVINYLLATMLNLRFDEASSDPEAAATDYWGYTWRWSGRSRFFYLGTQPKNGKVEEALKELLLEKESMKRFAFTQNELDRAKLDLVSYMENLLSEKDKRDSRSFLNGFISHFLTGDDMADIEWEVDAVNKLLPGIGINEIAAAINEYFAVDDIVVFLLAPQAEEKNLPSVQRIKDIFREVENTELSARQEVFISGELLYITPSAGKIVSQEIDAETGAQKIVLSNGVNVILKETANRNNEIIFYAMAKGGTVNAEQDTIFSVSLTSEMINVSGLGPYSRTELIKKLTGKQVSFSFWVSNYYRGFQGSSTAQDLKTFFEMLYLFFTMPSADERAIAAMLDQYRTNLAHIEDDPQGVFSRELGRIVSGNHPLFTPLELEDINKISIEQAFDFIGNCINPADYTFIFTGNINTEIMLEYLTIYLASIPNTVSMDSWVDPGIKRPRESEHIIYKGKDERSLVYLAWFTDGSSGFDEKKNQVAATLSEYLDILFTDEIREKLGGVYSIYSGVSVSVIPRGEYSLSVYFQCNPERTNELITAVQDCLVNVIKNDVNEDMFNKAKEALLKEHESSIQRNLYIAQSYANSSVLYNTPLSRLNRRPSVIKDVTPEDLQVLCREIIIGSPVQVVLYPEGWER